MILITADLHLRLDCPKCRTDDFIAAQWAKMEQLQQIINKYKITCWLDAGDIFHKAKPPLELIIQTMQHWPDLVCNAVAGNHDLPSHSVERLDESAFGLLVEAGKIARLGEEPLCLICGGVECNIYGADYKSTLPKATVQKDTRNILVLHDMIYPNRKESLPNAPGSIATTLLKRLDYDLIISGHNHQQFDIQVNDKMLVNVGCLTRQTSDMIDFKPRVVIYDPNRNKIIPIYLDYKKDTITREHLEKQEEKESRISAFVETLQNGNNTVDVTFEGNLQNVIAETQPEKLTQDKIWEAVK